MCLAVPGRIIRLSGGEGLERVGTVSFGGVTKDISLAYVPEAAPGDFVIVHAGFALSIVDEEEAEKTIALLKDLERRIGSGEADA